MLYILFIFIKRKYEFKYCYLSKTQYVLGYTGSASVDVIDAFCWSEYAQS